jgi:hypothetical protein
MVMTGRRLRGAILTALLAVAPSPVVAQIYESVGIRAQGLAGAFVAVADDATATWWNPAGLASGAFFNGIVEYGRRPDTDGDTVGVSFAIPSLGVSYYRLRIPGTVPLRSTETRDGDRQDLSAAGTRLSTTVLTQFGVTVGQSLGDHLVVGSTVNLVQAGVTRGDVDIGAMGRFGPVRAAVVVKHLAEPQVIGGEHPEVLPRQVRVGAMYALPDRGGRSMLAAFDADLTTTGTAFGDERHVAGGIELWLSRRFGIRGGMSANTTGTVRPSASGGLSVAVRSGIYLEAQATGGDDTPKTGWSGSARMTF